MKRFRFSVTALFIFTVLVALILAASMQWPVTDYIREAKEIPNQPHHYFQRPAEFWEIAYRTAFGIGALIAIWLGIAAIRE